MATAKRAQEQNNVEIVWEPQPGPQSALLSCPCFEIFFGGARGGGKTDGVLGEFASHADMYGENAIGLMVRRQRTELLETIERSRQLYAPLGWKWHEQDKMWRAPNGARLRFAYLERDSDADSYQGHSYTRLYIEEAGTFPSEKPILKLMATLRSGAGVPVGVRLTGNPGGPGQHWVRARYIDPAPAGWEVHTRTFDNPFTGETVSRDWVYIPSKVTDNEYLGAEYIANLQMSGSPQLVRAWLEGDWDVIEGAYFDNWDASKHVIRPFKVPDHWMRFGSFDWGSARPFSYGLWAVSDGDELEDGRQYPAGALIRIAEDYGAQSPNVGLKLHAEEVARRILALEGEYEVRYRTADPSCFSMDGGPSIAERMNREGVAFRRADNKRVAAHGAMGGWDQVRSRLSGEDGVPMIYFFHTCKDTIRTLPMLQHDENRPEDIDTESEDHCFKGDTLVRTNKGVYSIDDLVGTSGKVLSHDGKWHDFRSARRVKSNQEIVRLAFSDGSYVECTPDHRFLTQRGWTEAKDMAGIKTLSLSAPRAKNIAQSGITSAADTINEKVCACIARYGRTLTGQFLTGSTSTTMTTTGPIITSPTWSAFHPEYILEIGTARKAPNGGESTFKKPLRGLASGIQVQRAENGTRSNISASRGSSTGKASTSANSAARAFSLSLASFVRTVARQLGGASRALTMNPERVRSVAHHSRSIDIPRSGPARAIAGLLPAHAQELECLSVSEAGRADVYCLTVPETGNFTLGNGVIVSNCADDVRYACMSRPYVVRKVQPEETRWEMTIDEMIAQKRRKRLHAD